MIDKQVGEISIQKAWKNEQCLIDSAANPYAPWTGPTKRRGFAGTSRGFVLSLPAGRQVDFSCFVLCVKAKNEVGIRGEAPGSLPTMYC